MYYPMLNKFFNTFFRGNFPKHGKQVYLDHVNEVKQLVPPENLLMFNISDGWEPLCNFLSQPVPDEPFPRSNDISSFIERSQRRNKKQMMNATLQFLVTVLQMLLAGLVLYLAVKQFELDSWSSRLNGVVYSIGRIGSSS
jgi:hypothetical protein